MLKDLQTRRREAAANLESEEAARLGDEIKRLNALIKDQMEVRATARLSKRYAIANDWAIAVTNAAANCGRG